MNDPQEVRRNVATTYAAAVSEPRVKKGGCCGPSPGGVTAKLAGYTTEELRSLPDEAVEYAFGCGNPLAMAELRPGDVVIDLGSGAGIDVLLAAGRVGPAGKVIGIDMTDAMIAKARENIAAAGLGNAEIRKGTIEALPVESASVDWVLSNCVINLSPEKGKVFTEIARVLKPGGRMRVSDIVVSFMPDVLRDDAALHASCIAGAISEEAYVAGLREAGLTDVRVLGRVVYTEDQLLAFAQSIECAPSTCAASPSAKPDRPVLRDLAVTLAGRIWSAAFSARKP